MLFIPLFLQCMNQVNAAKVVPFVCKHTDVTRVLTVTVSRQWRQFQIKNLWYFFNISAYLV